MKIRIFYSFQFSPVVNKYRFFISNYFLQQAFQKLESQFTTLNPQYGRNNKCHIPQISYQWRNNIAMNRKTTHCVIQHLFFLKITTYRQYDIKKSSASPLAPSCMVHIKIIVLAKDNHVSCWNKFSETLLMICSFHFSCIFFA